MKKKLNSTPLIIVAVIILAVILVVLSNRNLNKPKNNDGTDKQTPNTEQSLIDEIETIRIENTTDFDLIDIDRELDLL